MERGEDFAFETTLSGRTYLRLLHKLKVAGYGIHIVFLWLPSPELALSRIRERIAMRGHSVPEEDALRRYHRSTANFFQHYSQFADSWILLNNVDGSPILIARKDSAGLLIMNQDLFALLKAKYGRAKAT